MLLFLLVLYSSIGCLQALKFSVVPKCINPNSADFVDGEKSSDVPGIAIHATAAEFYASFASIFRLSDGSRIQAPLQEKTESLRYIQDLLYMIGVYVNETASRDNPRQEATAGDVLQICGSVSFLFCEATGDALQICNSVRFFILNVAYACFLESMIT